MSDQDIFNTYAKSELAGNSNPADFVLARYEPFEINDQSAASNGVLFAANRALESATQSADRAVKETVALAEGANENRSDPGDRQKIFDEAVSAAAVVEVAKAQSEVAAAILKRRRNLGRRAAIFTTVVGISIGTGLAELADEVYQDARQAEIQASAGYIESPILPDSNVNRVVADSAGALLGGILGAAIGLSLVPDSAQRMARILVRRKK